MCYCKCNMFKSLTGFEIQAISVGIKKKIIEKIWHNKKKKNKKFQDHCVQNSHFQGFHKHIKNPKTIRGTQGIQVQVATLLKSFYN